MATTPTFATFDVGSKNWNSLQRLKGGLALLLIADALFLVALLMGQTTHRSLLQTIGRNSAPSIIAAQHIKVAIADMDAEAANEMLAKPGEGMAAAKAFQARREEAGGALIEAAKNITYDGEWPPIKSLQTVLGDYEARIQRARDLREGDDPQFIKAYRDASGLVEVSLFRAADELDRVNLKALDDAFESDRSTATHTRELISASGLILLGLLVYLQWDLTKRVRRLINPALLAASILTLALIVFANNHLSGADKDLYVARHDAFISLHALWQARAVAYSANADESKFLLGDDNSNDETSFFEKSKRIMGSAVDSSGIPEGGFLGEEERNITFAGEKEAADATVATWRNYLKIDAKLRQLKRDNRRDAAIALCIGKNPGESDWAFSSFDDALNRTIDINQNAFDSAVASGFQHLDQFDLTVVVGVSLISICCSLGLFIRIREYL